MGLSLKVNQPLKAKLSIIIPCYNEELTILTLLKKVCQINLDRPYEIIIVNDGSIDRSEEYILGFIKKNPNFPIFYLPQENQGKGGAVLTGIKNCSGDIILIQDADLEYDPSDYPKLLTEIDRGSKVVYGSRNKNTYFRPHSGLSYFLGGILITKITNLLFGSNLTDEATGYKVFTKDIFNNVEIKNKDFAWEPEITAKILKKQIPIAEVSITYFPRKKNEGKKINWRDGVKAIWVLINEFFKK